MDSGTSEQNLSDFTKDSVSDDIKKNLNVKYFLVLPLIVFLFSILGFFGNIHLNSNPTSNFSSIQTIGKSILNTGTFNILSEDDLSSNIKDTVYTDKNCWLELKINQQMLYQYWRDGHVEKYPVSTGNKYGDAEALESRPGLFAIFLKEEHHVSTQFSSANMYNFMPFNQGIGFHALDGTGYYGHLGVRPSSHGCIRMKHTDAKKLFKDCPLGTLVLATNGYSARTVAFAPEGFKNEKEYTKDEYKAMLALNLYNILNGKYYTEEREKFVLDPKVIPVSGVYISYNVRIPKKQIVPRSFLVFADKQDKIKAAEVNEILEATDSEEFVKFVSSEGDEENADKNHSVTSTQDMIKKYFHNPIGILPYFGPKR